MWRKCRPQELKLTKQNNENTGQFLKSRTFKIMFAALCSSDAGFDNYHKTAAPDHVCVPKFWPNTKKHISGAMSFT